MQSFVDRFRAKASKAAYGLCCWVRAMEVYERNIQLSSRAGAAHNEWTIKSRERLEHLRELLRQEEERERREHKETTGQPPRS